MSGRRSRPTPVSATTDQEAALYDSVVVPRYSSLFGQMLLQQIPDNARATVLDIGCGTGHPTFEVLRRLDDGGRVVGIDRDHALLDIARRKALDLAGKRLFFKVGFAEELEFGDQVFDIVIGNLVMPQLDSPADALAEMKRVLVPSGQLLLTRATEGTFEEVLDMLREVALREDLPSIEQRVEQVAARYPSAQAFANQVRAAGFADVEVTEEVFRLPFRSAREMFEDPLIGFVGMSEWRWIAGLDDGGRRVIAAVRKSLDTYFAGGPLSLTARGCLVSARSPRGLGG